MLSKDHRLQAQVLSGKGILGVKDAMGHAEETARSILTELLK